MIWTKKKALSLFAVISVVIGIGVLAGFLSSDSLSTEKADLVVYGKIFTSEGNQMVEAFAVKDGKYIYVGDKAGAEALVEEGKTEVIDYSGKGLVMPSCGNGHAHYSMAYAVNSVGTIVEMTDKVDKFFNEIVPAAVKKAKETGATIVYGHGWDQMIYPKDLNYRKKLDAICSDIPIFFSDEEGHKGVANTILLVKAGIMKADGTPLKTDIRGGEVVLDAHGVPTGYLKEQAGTYVRSFIDNEKLFSVDIAKQNMASIQEQLLKEGYTMYLDGWANYFFNENFYKAAHEMDQDGNMHIVLGTAYEIESWMDVSGTGFVDPLYPDGHQGISNWSEDELTDITRKANAKGITMHVHVMGNKGVTRIVNAYVNGGKDEMRNTLVHVYKADTADFQRMADHHIYVTSGMLWHHVADEAQTLYMRYLPEGMKDKGYPMKSFFDHGINVSSHSDYPAVSASPDDPFGIMEIAVTGVLWSENGTPWWPEELATREQTLTAMTINCAKQMFIENERGSIKTGKYADFLLLNQDVLTCPVTEIHSTKPTATYFEGKKVYSK